jgi:hypothetical protein
MQYLTNLITFLLPALSSLRLSIVEDTEDLFSDRDNQDNTDSQESPLTPFDINIHHDEQEYNNEPMQTGTNHSLELYEVKESSKGLTLLYREPKHDGIASENYQFNNGNQRFVLESWITRFKLEGKLFKETFAQDLTKAMRSLQGETFTAVVEKQAGEKTLYNINSRKS